MKSQLVVNKRGADDYWSTPLTGVVRVHDAVERIAVLPYMLILDCIDWAMRTVEQSLRQSRRAQRSGEIELASRFHDFALEAANLALRRGPGPANNPLTLRSQHEPRSVWEDELKSYCTHVLLPGGYPPLGNATFMLDATRRIFIADPRLHGVALRFCGDAVLPVSMSSEELTERLAQVRGT